jgi:hypothetical protein
MILSFGRKADKKLNKKGKDFHLSLSWYHLELNQGHTDFQSVALPTELWYLFSLLPNLPIVIGLSYRTPFFGVTKVNIFSNPQKNI